MSKGYRIIEPNLLAQLTADPKHDEFLVTILHWLISELRTELSEELAEVELEVIRVEYMGAYPALGIHYEPMIPFESQLEKLVEETIEKLLQDKSAIEFIRFIASSETDWREKTNAIMKK